MQLTNSDALIVVDVQRDFLPGGSLAVPDGDAVVPVLNEYLRLFRDSDLPIVATRDWHPPRHCSFAEQGGIWPKHCVQGSPGAEFAAELRLPDKTHVVSKATKPDAEAYSGFDGTRLAEWLKDSRVRRLFIGGLATDYCVQSTVADAVKAGFDVVLLADAIRAVNVEPDDGARAMEAMRKLGVGMIERAGLEADG